MYISFSNSYTQYSFYQSLLFKAFVISVLTYRPNSETWTLTAELERKLAYNEMTCQAATGEYFWGLQKTAHT